MIVGDPGRDAAPQLPARERADRSAALPARRAYLPAIRRVPVLIGGRFRDPLVVALACALLAVIVGILAAVAALGPGGGISTLVHIASTDRVAPLVRAEDPGFHFVGTKAHYDGTYFYSIARDPLATGRYHDLIDAGAKRYGHAFYGQLAWALSFGQAYRVPWALLLITLAALAVAAFCASRIADVLGWSPWAGIAVALSPGLLYAATADTSEPVGAAFIGLGVLAWLRGRRGWAALAFVATSLTKEPLSLVPVGVLVFEAVRVMRRDGWRPAVRSVRGRWRPVAFCLAGPLVLIGWTLYVHSRFDRLPLSGNPTASTFPYAGLIDTLRVAGRYGQLDAGRIQAGAVAIPLVLVLAVAMTIGIVVAVRLRTIVDAVFLFTAPLMLALNPDNVLYPKDFLRLTAVSFLLLLGVLIRPGRRDRAQLPSPDRPGRPPQRPGRPPQRTH